VAEDNWTDKLEMEELRGNETLMKYETPEAALQGLVEAQTLIGKKGIIPPGEDATDAEKEAFNKAIGEHAEVIKPLLVQVPEKPEDYGLKVPDDLPEGLTADERLLTGFAETAQKVGLTKDQAAGLFEFYNKHILEQHDQGLSEFEDHVKRGEEVLRKKYGAEYDKKIDLAKSVIKRFGNRDLVKYMDTQGLSNDPAFIAYHVAIGEAIDEAVLNQDGDGTTNLFTGRITREKLREMQRDPRYADPQRRDNDFIKRVQEGYKKLAEQEAKSKAA